MDRTRITLKVCVDLDPIDGMFHTPKSAQNAVLGILESRIPHYKPSVAIESDDAGENYTACAFALGEGRYCRVDVRIPHVHPTLRDQKRTVSGGIPWGEDLSRDCRMMQDLESIGIFPGGYHYNNCSIH